MVDAAQCRVAVVDDEEVLRTTLSIALEQEGYSVRTHADGLSAWHALQEEPADIAILDVIMPGMDGIDLCRRLRDRWPDLPVLFLSSRNDEIDRILGLETGGDDYLGKPFSLRELLARMKVFRRRMSPRQTEDSRPGSSPPPAGGNSRPACQEHGGPADSLVLEAEACRAWWKGSLLGLSITEFRILSCLARIPGHVKTREQLMEAAYPEPTWVEPRTMDTHIRRIRRKAREADPDFEAIESVHGMGYRLQDLPASR